MKPSLVAAAAVGLFLLLGLAAQPAQAAPEAKFYETTVIADTDNDYNANGALDIVAVHISEKYFYSPEKEAGNPTVNFRIQLRNFKDMETFQGHVPISFTLAYTLGGQQVLHTAIVNQTCGAGLNGIQCGIPTTPSPNFIGYDANEFSFVLDGSKESLPAGTPLTNVFVASATVPDPSAVVYQDAAPKDNGNSPQGSDLTGITGEDYKLQGLFPFLGAALKVPGGRPAVPGGEAKFVVHFTTHAELSTTDIDRIIVKYKAPTGWTTQANVQGDISIRGNTATDLEVTVKAPATAALGDNATIQLQAFLIQASGYGLVDLNVTITAPRIDDPAYDIQLATPGPFKSGEDAVLRWTAAKEGAPLAHFQFGADFVLAGNLEGSRSTARGGIKETADGTYETTFAFPSKGDWTVDVYVSELNPAPHKVFPVQVTGGGGGIVPGFEIVAALGALAVVAWRRFA